jgi:biotin operon repressor
MSIYGKQTNEKPETRAVLRYFQQRRRLSKKVIAKTLGAEECQVPSFIASLRLRGYLIDSEKDPARPREVKMYEYRGRGKSKVKKHYVKKYTPYQTQEENIKVPCMICGANVVFKVLQGDTDYDTRRMCQYCKDTAETRRGNYKLCKGDRSGIELSRRIEKIVSTFRNEEQKKVKHYKRGTPGFDRIAAQCTPPGEIRDTTLAKDLPDFRR